MSVVQMTLLVYENITVSYRNMAVISPYEIGAASLC